MGLVPGTVYYYAIESRKDREVYQYTFLQQR